MEEQNQRYMLDLIEGHADRANRRLFILLIVVIGLWFATIGLFIWYLNQYDFESYSTEYTQDGHGVNIFGSGNGVDFNGAEIKGSEEGEAPEVGDGEGQGQPQEAEVTADEVPQSSDGAGDLGLYPQRAAPADSAAPVN